MRILLVVLLSLPSLITAGCGCEEVEEELERERTADADFHACRSCKTIVPSAAACPFSGYECDPNWPLTTNTLTANNNCQCLEARCAGKAKLAFDGDIVGKMRCNSSKWMVGEEIADNVVCAKSCDKGICKAFHPKASSDFAQLQVHPATATTTCATGDCSHGIAVLNADGSLFKHLDNSVLSVSCSADGNWVYGEGEKSKYVMCNAKPICKCAATQLTDGSVNSLCPFGSICVKPLKKDDCEAKCPAESTPIYQTAAGMPMTSPAIMCNGADWIVADKDNAAGVTCKFAPNKGYTTSPPTNASQCPLLGEEPCPGPLASCNFSQLIYVDGGDKTARAMCKKGSIVTNDSPAGTLGIINCRQSGPWEEGTKTANCVTDKLPVTECLDALSHVSVKNNVDFACEYGTCRLSCKGADQQFQYEVSEIPPRTELNKYLNCVQREPIPVKGGVLANFATVKCV